MLPYDCELHAEVFADAGAGLRLLIGCVDNSAARRAIAATLDSPRWQSGYPSSSTTVWWCDTGNGRNAGQVLLGNTTRRQGLRGGFLRDLDLCRALPAPSLQRPDLLDAPPPSKPQPDCAEAIAQAEQGPTINQVVASIAASYVEKLLNRTCRWMASYFDLDDGTLRCIPADPKAVAGTVGLRSSVTLTRASAQAA